MMGCALCPGAWKEDRMARMVVDRWLVVVGLRIYPDGRDQSLDGWKGVTRPLRIKAAGAFRILRWLPLTFVRSFVCLCVSVCLSVCHLSLPVCCDRRESHYIKFNSLLNMSPTT